MIYYIDPLKGNDGVINPKIFFKKDSKFYSFINNKSSQISRANLSTDRLNPFIFEYNICDNQDIQENNELIIDTEFDPIEFSDE